MIFDPCSLQRRGGCSYRQGWSERVPYETCVSSSRVNWRARYGCTLIYLVRIKNKNIVGQSRSNNRKRSGQPAAFAKEISVTTWYYSLALKRPCLENTVQPRNAWGARGRKIDFSVMLWPWVLWLGRQGWHSRETEPLPLWILATDLQPCTTGDRSHKWHGRFKESWVKTVLWADHDATTKAEQPKHRLYRQM